MNKTKRLLISAIYVFVAMSITWQDSLTAIGALGAGALGLNAMINWVMRPMNEAWW